MSEETGQAIRSNLWIGLGVLGGALCAMVNYGLAVRFLRAEDAGLLGVISSVITASLALGGLGFGPALVREASKAGSDSEKMRDAVGVALLLACVLGGLCLGLLLIGAGAIIDLVKYEGDRANALVYCGLAGLTVLLTQLSSVHRSLAQARCNFKACTLCDLLYAVIQLAGIFVLIRYPHLTAVGVVNLAAAIAQLVVYCGLTRRMWGIIFPPKWSTVEFRQLWSFGRWMQLGSIMGIMGDTLDKIVLAAYFGPASIPAYLMARRFYSQSHGLLASQAYYLFPKLSAAKTEGADRVDENARIERSAGGIIALVAGLIYTGVFAIGPLLVGWTATESVAVAVTPILGLFCVIGWVQSLTLVTYFTKLAKGYSKVATIANLLAGPGTLVAMILLGMSGHWYAAIAGQLLILIGTFWLLGLGEDNRSTVHQLVCRFGIGIVPGVVTLLLCLVVGAIRTSFGLLAWPSIVVALAVCVLYLPLVFRLPAGWPNQSELRRTTLRILEQSPIGKKMRMPVLAALGMQIAA